MRKRMLAGEPYLPDDPELMRDRRRAMALTEAFNRSSASEPDEQRQLLIELLDAFGEGSEIRPPLYCDYGYQTRIGKRCFANFGLVILDVARVTIGDDVQIGPYVQLLTATHPVEARARREKWESAAPVMVMDNVWLAAAVIVCPGVTIGANTVVGAGSVVTRDLPANVVAMGSPARVVRSIEP